MTANAQRLYTIFMEFQGGTYISQLSASNESSALSCWPREASDEDLRMWGLNRDELSEIVTTEDLVPIAGCKSLWCASGTSRSGKLVLIHVIATAD